MNPLLQLGGLARPRFPASQASQQSSSQSGARDGASSSQSQSSGSASASRPRTLTRDQQEDRGDSSNKPESSGGRSHRSRRLDTTDGVRLRDKTGAGGGTDRRAVRSIEAMSRVVVSNLETGDSNNNGATASSPQPGTAAATRQAITAHSSMEDDDSYPLPTIYRCRAPIASLDCMEEFNGHGTDSSGLYGSTPGTKEHLLGLAAQSGRLPHSPSAGIRYRNLGKSGLRVSNVGLGTWTTLGAQSGSTSINEDNAEAVIALAYESGINVFDLSEAHSGPKAETQLGRILHKRNWSRTSYVVTTKIYWNPKSEARGLSRKYIIETVQASLARLQLSYIDIVMIHKVDPACPMEEIVRAMTYVINKGWVMYWGTSRWTPVEIMEAYSNCRQFNCVLPIVEQAEYHLFYREKPELYMPELYNKIGVGCMCWSAMSIGMISSRPDESAMSVLSRSRSSYRNKSFSWTEDDSQSCKEDNWRKGSNDSESRKFSDKVRDICGFAERLGCTFPQLAIAWSLKNEGVQCLLIGATTTEQLYESLQSLQLIPRLTDSTMTEIERILLNKPIRPPMISTLELR